MTETSPKQHRDITEIRPRQDQDTTETRPRHDQDTTETRPRHDRDTTETRPRHPGWIFFRCMHGARPPYPCKTPSLSLLGNKSWIAINPKGCVQELRIYTYGFPTELYMVCICKANTRDFIIRIIIIIPYTKSLFIIICVCLTSTYPQTSSMSLCWSFWMDILHGNLKAIESTSFRNLHLGGRMRSNPN